MGPDLANKVRTMQGKQVDAVQNTRRYEGLDLQLGGQGLKRLYDETIPRRMSEIAKKHAGKEVPITEHSLGIPDKDLGKPSVGNVRRTKRILPQGITITPEMRKKLQTQGIPIAMAEDQGSQDLA
jgi:hypothetical protein